MKINDVHRTGAVQRYQNQKAGTEGQATGKKGKAKDSLQISEAAKELLQVRGSEHANRSEKMEALKEAVQSGQYQVDAEKVAEKMLQYFKNPYRN
ncbi:flagellar biosynthesis anti-sigma factor FlgM [Marinicrinis sediminis]|uniref:Negative regulator of flagellin synthesis n=1 Tax=Marinicrinis sediminis TaxID=1652465 RepID=A0ABW5RBM4_9BACL